MKRTLPYFFLTIFLGVILGLNASFSFCSDDCVYALSWSHEMDGIRPHLGSFTTVWYENVADGHRPVVHFFVRLFTGWLGKGAFNVANTFMMGLLLLLLYRLAKKTWQISIHETVLMVTLVFLILCKGESYLWCAGSVNYLWAGTFTLAFCLLREHLEKDTHFTFSLIPLLCMTLLCGWVQEGFSLPICFALGIYSLLHLRALSKKKILFYFIYGIGAILLCLISGRRASTIPPPSIIELIITQVKIWVTLKGVWLVVLYFLFSKEKRQFLSRNAFELYVILGSYLMISIVGFNGERSLWCANLFAILILLREFKSPRWLTYVLVIILFPLWGYLLHLGVQIKQNFDTFISIYLHSPEGITYHERVNCGPFARFFHQSIYQWQSGLHSKTLGEYYGRPFPPLALTRELYDTLYLENRFCIPSNRLSIDGEYYTTETANLIAMPLNSLSEYNWNKVRTYVTYSYPNGLIAKVQLDLAKVKNPPVAHSTQTQILSTNHGTYLLIPKLPLPTKYIKGIKLSYQE